MKRKPESGSGKNAKGTDPSTPKSRSATVKPTPAQDVPGKIVPSKLADYLEIITIAVFQAGTSWAMVRNKWPNFRKAFAEFDPIAVSKFDQTDIDRLMQDTGILRSEKKIRGTIDNASALLALDSKYGSFQSYLRSFDGYDQLSADLQKRFKYLGEMSVYYFLFRVSEKVPPFEPWILTIEGDHPRMREMVEKAAAEDTR
jgi:3-methyladenine DNA glycosylase Tag